MSEPRDHLPDDDADDGEKRSLVDRVVPELVKRIVEGAVERAGERIADNSENIRQFVGDMKLPKEVLTHIYSQLDETKNGLYRVVAKEIRDVLSQTQFAEEITKVLTKLSFEIRTEIRFVPNRVETETQSDTGTTTLPRPKITSQVTMKDRKKEDS